MPRGSQLGPATLVEQSLCGSQAMRAPRLYSAAARGARKVSAHRPQRPSPGMLAAAKSRDTPATAAAAGTSPG